MTTNSNEEIPFKQESAPRPQLPPQQAIPPPQIEAEQKNEDPDLVSNRRPWMTEEDLHGGPAAHRVWIMCTAACILFTGAGSLICAAWLNPHRYYPASLGVFSIVLDLLFLGITILYIWSEDDAPGWARALLLLLAIVSLATSLLAAVLGLPRAA